MPRLLSRLRRSRAPSEAASEPSTATPAVFPVLPSASDEAAHPLAVLANTVRSRHLDLGRRSLVICAPSAGAGVTHVAANLAVALSQAGVKTLLIDGNLHAPRLAAMFGLPADATGLSHCLADAERVLGDAIHATAFPGLSLLPAGEARSDASELIGAEALKALAGACIRDFDVTIVDAPAANTSADARWLAAVFGYALIVSRRGATFQRDVRTLADELALDRATVIGLYLNRA